MVLTIDWQYVLFQTNASVNITNLHVGGTSQKINSNLLSHVQSVGLRTLSPILKFIPYISFG